MKTRKRKRKTPAPPPLSYWELKVWDTYKVARAAAEAGRVHRMTLRRHGGGARAYADYHARCYAERTLGKTYTDDDSDRFNRLWRSGAAA